MFLEGTKIERWSIIGYDVTITCISIGQIIPFLMTLVFCSDGVHMNLQIYRV